VSTEVPVERRRTSVTCGDSPASLAVLLWPDNGCSRCAWHISNTDDEGWKMDVGGWLLEKFRKSKVA